jgi:glyoxylase-like metal-dependent hydrolase (beta-lactamase superfamily II)
MTATTSALATPLHGVYATPPAPLPFAPSWHMRSFLLRRATGNVLVYGSPNVDLAAFADIGGISRAYLNHGHEAAFGEDLHGVPLFVHTADRDDVAGRRTIRATFSHRHVLDEDLEVIPTPGHTPGATAYLLDSGAQRLLFTGDTISLRDGDWVAAVLDSSDRDAYISSLELIRELDYDVLVPWAATAGGPYYSVTGRDDARRRVDAILQRIRRGEDR